MDRSKLLPSSAIKRNILNNPYYQKADTALKKGGIENNLLLD